MGVCLQKAAVTPGRLLSVCRLLFHLRAVCDSEGSQGVLSKSPAEWHFWGAMYCDRKGAGHGWYRRQRPTPAAGIWGGGGILGRAVCAWSLIGAVS